MDTTPTLFARTAESQAGRKLHSCILSNPDLQMEHRDNGRVPKGTDSYQPTTDKIPALSPAGLSGSGLYTSNRDGYRAFGLMLGNDVLALATFWISVLTSILIRCALALLTTSVAVIGARFAGCQSSTTNQQKTGARAHETSPARAITDHH